MVLKAVASSTKTPGVYIALDLLGPASNPGNAPLTTLLIAPKSSAGNITAQSEFRECFGPDDVATSHGPGTPGHLTAKRFYAKYPKGKLVVAAPTASAGAAATGTQTFSGTATENSTIRLRVHGRIIEVSWLSGEAATAFVTRAVAAINEQGNDLFVTAADGGSGDIDYTAKVAGPWGNDVRINASVYVGGDGITISANPTNLTGGTTEPNFTTVLDNAKTTEFARILPVLSNADAADTTSSSNGERLHNHIELYKSGRGALLQVGVIGMTSTTTSAKAGAIDRNNPAIQYVLGRAWDDLPGELAGDQAGGALAAIELRANANRIGEQSPLLYGPYDVVANRLSQAETEDLLSNGVSPMDVDANGARYLVAPITTHSTFSGSPDYRAYHLSDTDAAFQVIRGLRVALPQEFPQASITDDLPPGEELPAGVVERRDVHGFIVSYLRTWARRGVLERNQLDAAIASGELSVEIDDPDRSQVNIFIPFAVIKPLAKFGLAASKVA